MWGKVCVLWTSLCPSCLHPRGHVWPLQATRYVDHLGLCQSFTQPIRKDCFRKNGQKKNPPKHSPPWNEKVMIAIQNNLFFSFLNDSLFFLCKLRALSRPVRRKTGLWRLWKISLWQVLHLQWICAVLMCSALLHPSDIKHPTELRSYNLPSLKRKRKKKSLPGNQNTSLIVILISSHNCWEPAK